MPYRTFANLGLYIKHRNSPTSRARSVSIAKQWINRHGKFKCIALLQVLTAYPCLFNEFFEPKNDNYISTMKTLCKDCCELTGVHMIEIYEHSTVMQLRENCLEMIRGDSPKIRAIVNSIAHSTSFGEIISKLEWLNKRISQLNLSTTENQLLSEKFIAIGMMLDRAIDIMIAMLGDKREMLAKSMERLMSSRAARDMVEKILEREVCSQWHTNTI